MADKQNQKRFNYLRNFDCLFTINIVRLFYTNRKKKSSIIQRAPDLWSGALFNLYF